MSVAPGAISLAYLMMAAVSCSPVMFSPFLPSTLTERVDYFLRRGYRTIQPFADRIEVANLLHGLGHRPQKLLAVPLGDEPAVAADHDAVVGRAANQPPEPLLELDDRARHRVGRPRSLVGFAQPVEHRIVGRRER